jgi:hypothetical protein
VPTAEKEVSKSTGVQVKRCLSSNV